MNVTGRKARVDVEDLLNENDLFSMRSRWTARNAAPGQDWTSLFIQFQEAQSDIGRLLRHLGAFDGPPLAE
jgi:hypothetical protein